MLSATYLQLINWYLAIHKIVHSLIIYFTILQAEIFFHITFVHNNFILSLPYSHRVRKQDGASKTLTLQIMKMYVGFEVFMVVTMKNAIFWDVVLCGFIINRCFRGMCFLHRQGRRNSADYSLEALKAVGTSTIVQWGEVRILKTAHKEAKAVAHSNLVAGAPDGDYCIAGTGVML
jgi:hypothetical protein